MNLTAWSIRLRLTAAAGLAVMVLFGAAGSYLLAQAGSRYTEESRRSQVQIATDLAHQLTRALADGDDLAALEALKAARAIHPQLREAMVFERSGKIVLHTDPGMLGGSVQALSGPVLTAPEIRTGHSQGRPVSHITASLPGNEELAFRAVFDETPAAHLRSGLRMRLLALALVCALVVGAGSWIWLGRYEIEDPRRSPATAAGPGDEAASGRRAAELLLAALPHAALAIGRDNRVLAANTPALELLNCRPEELAGLHVLRSPLPESLTVFYREAVTRPETRSTSNLALAAKTPPLSVTLTCSPPSPEWELALVTLA